MNTLLSSVLKILVLSSGCIEVNSNKNENSIDTQMGIVV